MTLFLDQSRFSLGGLYQRNDKTIVSLGFLFEELGVFQTVQNPIKKGDLILIVGVYPRHYDILRVNSGNVKDRLHREDEQGQYWTLLSLGTMEETNS